MNAVGYGLHGMGGAEYGTGVMNHLHNANTIPMHLHAF